jgi:ABC-type Fe3+-hydroxamate transport system substrate-binding protein
MKKLLALLLAAALVIALVACNNDNNGGNGDTTATEDTAVTDDNGNPVVTDVSGNPVPIVTDEEGSAVTDEAGNPIPVATDEEGNPVMPPPGFDNPDITMELLGVWNWVNTGSTWYIFNPDGRGKIFGSGAEIVYMNDIQWGTRDGKLFICRHPLECDSPFYCETAAVHEYEINDDGSLTLTNSEGSSFNYVRA